jgi:hypothetical protein
LGGGGVGGGGPGPGLGGDAGMGEFAGDAPSGATTTPASNKRASLTPGTSGIKPTISTLQRAGSGSTLNRYSVLHISTLFVYVDHRKCLGVVEALAINRCPM